MSRPEVKFGQPQRAEVFIGMHAETMPAGFHRIASEKLPHEIMRRTTVLTDGRRLDGPSTNGFQLDYFKVLPPGTPVDVLWSGAEVSEQQGRKALAVTVSELAKVGPTAVLLTGGEHVHPKKKGSKKEPNPLDLITHGGYDLARDRVGDVLLDHVELTDSKLIAICRGSQQAIRYYSRRLANLDDHEQEEHKHRETDEGPSFAIHAVKSALPEGLQEFLTTKLPEVREVNSAHAQGYKVSDIDDEAMLALNENGWYPWLVADLPDVKPENQTYEAWIRVGSNGELTGIMTQFHPERDDNPHIEVRELMKELMGAEVQVPS